MIYTSQPPSGPAHRAWMIFCLMGEVLELEDEAGGFWRVRYVDEETGEELVKHVPAKNLEAISDERVAEIRDMQKRAEEMLRRAEEEQQRIIAAKLADAEEEPGPLTADIIYEKRGKKLVARLHIRKRRPDEHGSGQQ